MQSSNQFASGYFNNYAGGTSGSGPGYNDVGGEASITMPGRVALNQQHHSHQLSSLQFHEYNKAVHAQVSKTNNINNSAAQIRTVHHMKDIKGSNFMRGAGEEDPSSSMHGRYQSCHPDYSQEGAFSMKQQQQVVSSPPNQDDSPTSTNVAQLSGSNTAAFTLSPSNNNQPPFVFDGYAGWVCRHCSHLTHYYRGPNYVWMGRQQPPPHQFVQAHLRICPAVNNHPWASRTAAADPSLQLILGNDDQSQISAQQVVQTLYQSDANKTDNSSQTGAGGGNVDEQESSSRKRRHDVSNAPSSTSGREMSLLQQAPMDNTSEANMSQSTGMWHHQNFPSRMLSQWGVQGGGGILPGMSPAAGPTLDDLSTERSPSSAPLMVMTVKNGSVGTDTMAPQSPAQKHAGVVVHTSSIYPLQRPDDMMFPPSAKKQRSSQKKAKTAPVHVGIHSSDEDYAKALSFLRKRAEDMPPVPSSFGVDDVSLIEEGESNLLTDYFYFIMSQLSVCRLTEKDRKTRGGKRQDVAVGYGGLQCIHCANTPSGRKFFWSNVDRLANSFAGIPDHVLTCKMCPKDVVEALLVLKGRHNAQMSCMTRGSQKHFFRRMWERLHAGDLDAAAAAASTSSSLKRRDSTAADIESPPSLESDDAAAAEALKKSGSTLRHLPNAEVEGAGGKAQAVSLPV